MVYVNIEIKGKEIVMYYNVSYSFRVLVKVICTCRELHDEEYASAKNLVLPRNYC